MPNQKLIEWVSLGLSKGYSLADLKKRMLETGYPTAEVDKLFIEHFQGKQKQSSPGISLQKSHQAPTSSSTPSSVSDKKIPIHGEKNSPGNDKETVQVFSREDDVITKEDFAKLETEEIKKQPFYKRLIGKKRDKAQKDEKTKEKKVDPSGLEPQEVAKLVVALKEKLDSFMIDLEKTSGKVEMEQNLIKSTNERILDLAEQIGDLRTTILDRERFFDKMETQFMDMKENINHIKPDKLEKQFKEQEMHLLKAQSKIDKNEHFIKHINEGLKKIKDKIASIKDFDNLADTLEQIKKSQKIISQNKNFVDKSSAKIEMIFREIKDAVDDINQNKKEIKAMQDIEKDVMKDIDKISIKLSGFIKKDELNKLQKQINVLKSSLFEKERKNFESHVVK